MPAKVCCVTGHRIIPLGRLEQVKADLRELIRRAVRTRYGTFISGYADGADLLFARLVQEFQALLARSNTVTVVCEEYTPDCSFIRNRWMVDQSDALIAVYDGRERGGTFYTIRYARSASKKLPLSVSANRYYSTGWTWWQRENVVGGRGGDNMGKRQRPGSFCKVCGVRQANANFSGNGDSGHICKACESLSIAERDAMQAINVIEGMAKRYIDGSEIIWLRERMNDPCRAVREAARMVYSAKFERRERGRIKNGLTAYSLEFYLCGAVWQESGTTLIHVRIMINREGALKLIDYSAPQTEHSIQIAEHEAQEFLRLLIQQWDILFWGEDLGDYGPDEDPISDPALELFSFIDKRATETETALPLEPLWSVKLNLSNGNYKEIVFFNQMHDEPQELLWALTNFFEPVEA